MALQKTVSKKKKSFFQEKIEKNANNSKELLEALKFIFFLSMFFFQEHSLFTGQQEKGEGIYLTPLYHLNPLHRHLDISRTITADSSPLHIACSRIK